MSYAGRALLHNNIKLGPLCHEAMRTDEQQAYVLQHRSSWIIEDSTLKLQP